VAQWQLFFTLFAALAMKVNLDNENLQNKGYFDIVLTFIQFVPALIVCITNVVNAKMATDKIKGGLLGSFMKSRGEGEGGLEMGDIVSNPVLPGNVQVATREDRSHGLLGGEVVSKHEKRKG
jgi:hypothetical protein